MKELEIPYIGVKIESLPTILKTIDQSKNDKEFIDFYRDLGKSAKTASEYLASLRNLKLAKKDASGNTTLLTSAKNLVTGDIENLYSNLLQHCLRNFHDLKIVFNLVKKHKPNSLPDLQKLLEENGYKIRRQQTLSSYFKLLVEGSKQLERRRHSPIISLKKEPIEYHQFLKLLFNYATKKMEKRIVIEHFYNWVNEKYKLERAVLMNYLIVAKDTNKIKLIEINPRVLNSPDEAFNINNKIYYYIELL